MDFSSLPPELQVQYLIGLPPGEILNYCQTSTSAQRICDDPYFWDQKGIQDFGFPFSLLCKMSPYWGYRFLEYDQENIALLGVLVRAGRLDLAERFVEETRVGEHAIYDAISTDDIATLKFLKPFILKFKSPKGTDYYLDSFFKWLRTAFRRGSDQSIKYFISIDPDYLYDVMVLDEILKVLPQDSQRQRRILAPYIEEMNRRIPDLYERTVDLPSIHSYLERM